MVAGRPGHSLAVVLRSQAAERSMSRFPGLSWPVRGGTTSCAASAWAHRRPVVRRRPHTRLRDGRYRIETTSRTGWAPACGTTIASGRGCISTPSAVGPWPVIVTRYLPGARSAVNRPLRSARTCTEPPAPARRSFTPGTGAGAPGAGPPHGDDHAGGGHRRDVGVGGAAEAACGHGQGGENGGGDGADEVHAADETVAVPGSFPPPG
jgi:hypothetical protein